MTPNGQHVQDFHFCPPLDSPTASGLLKPETGPRMTTGQPFRPMICGSPVPETLPVIPVADICPGCLSVGRSGGDGRPSRRRRRI